MFTCLNGYIKPLSGFQSSCISTIEINPIVYTMLRKSTVSHHNYSGLPLPLYIFDIHTFTWYHNRLI